MHKGLVERIKLICPRCRRAGADGIVQSSLKLDQVFKQNGDFILEAFLVCLNNDCSCTYPIVEGVPIVLKDMRGWWCSEKSKFFDVSSSSPEIRGYFEAMDLSEAASYAERSLLSSYLDLHYGAFSELAFAEWTDSGRYWETVIDMARPVTGSWYEHSLDLGCAVGRYTFELARFSDLAVGLDLNFSMVSSAARIQQVQRVEFERKEHGRCFERFKTPYSTRQNVLFLVGDALDPPFSAESFDFVAGLNLLDNVRLPLVLIGQMDALLRPGGVLLLGSPYEWRADISEPSEWLESKTLDAPVMVRSILEGNYFPQMGLKYCILSELSDVRWAIRHHIRYWSLFLTHLIKAQKCK